MNGLDHWEDGALVLNNKLYILNDKDLNKKILDEAYSFVYTTYLGSTKIYQTLKDHYWWKDMKWEIV